MHMHTLEDAMRAAAAMRKLRDEDLDDARRYRVIRDRCTEPTARRFMARQVRQFVAAARQWQRQLLSAQRHIRRSLMQRRSPATIAVRGLAALRLDGRIAE